MLQQRRKPTSKPSRVWLQLWCQCCNLVLLLRCHHCLTMLPSLVPSSSLEFIHHQAKNGPSSYASTFTSGAASSIVQQARTCHIHCLMAAWFPQSPSCTGLLGLSTGLLYMRHPGPLELTRSVSPEAIQFYHRHRTVSLDKVPYYLVGFALPRILITRARWPVYFAMSRHCKIVLVDTRYITKNPAPPC